MSAHPLPWCGGDALQTGLLEAMSLLAPEVERFVIDAVRDALRGLDPADPQVAAGRAFMREEAAHSAAHHAFNRRVQAGQRDPSQLLRGPRTLAALARSWMPLRARLCVAAAAEHLSAVVSRLYLDSAARQAIADPGIRALFDRHATEEIAHRAVVFDLARAVGTNGWLARLLALTASVAASALCVAAVLLALRRGGERPTAAWRLGAGALPALRRTGWLRPAALVGALARYVRPHFHPTLAHPAPAPLR